MVKFMRLYYGWVVAAVSFLALATYGLFYSFGVFLNPLMDEFGWSRTAISATFTIYVVVYTLAATPMGWLLDRFGPHVPLALASLLIGVGIALSGKIASLWQLYFFFGGVAGVGHGALYVIPVSATVSWFKERRGLVMGMVTSGMGAGIFLTPILAHNLIQGYGWRQAFLILGFIFFAITALAAAVTRRQDEMVSPSQHSQGRGLRLGEVMRIKSFWLLYVSFVFIVASDRMIVTHTVSYAMGTGIEPKAAAQAFGLLGIGGIVGRLGLGALSDRLGRRETLCLSYFLEAVGIVGLMHIKGAAMLSGAMFLLGFSYGGFVAILGPVIREFFGPAHMGKIMGFVFTSGALAGPLGPLLGGYLSDVGSYWWSFSLAAVLSGAAVLLCFLCRPPHYE